MPSLLLVLPPILLLLLAVLFAYWLIISILLASAGHPHQGHMRYDERLQWFFVFHTIGILWTAEMVLHLGFCSSAGAVAKWYFASNLPYLTLPHLTLPYLTSGTLPRRRR